MPFPRVTLTTSLIVSRTKDGAVAWVLGQDHLLLSPGSPLSNFVYNHVPQFLQRQVELVKVQVSEGLSGDRGFQWRELMLNASRVVATFANTFTFCIVGFIKDLPSCD